MEAAEFLRLYWLGYTDAQMATALGVSITTIRRKRAAAQLQPQRAGEVATS